MKITPIRATTLTPFNYGHLAVQGGVATIPVRIDPQAPLAELPGNPQTLWKRTVLATLTGRVLADIGIS